MERQASAPGLVDDQRLTPPVTHLGDAADVRARAVRGRVASASGYFSHAAATCAGNGGCAWCSSRSHRGWIHFGCNPKTRPAVTDLWGSPLTKRSPPNPVTASIAAFTDNELPQVEKNACSAPTASVINCWAGLQQLPRRRPVVQPGADDDIRPEVAAPQHFAGPGVNTTALPVTGRGEPIPIQRVILPRSLHQRRRSLIHPRVLRRQAWAHWSTDTNRPAASRFAPRTPAPGSDRARSDVCAALLIRRISSHPAAAHPITPIDPPDSPLVAAVQV